MKGDLETSVEWEGLQLHSSHQKIYSPITCGWKRNLPLLSGVCHTPRDHMLRAVHAHTVQHEHLRSGKRTRVPPANGMACTIFCYSQPQHMIHSCAGKAAREWFDCRTLNQRAGSMLHSGRATPPMTGTQPSCRDISTHFHEFLRPTINCIAAH